MNQMQHKSSQDTIWESLEDIRLILWLKKVKKKREKNVVNSNVVTNIFNKINKLIFMDKKILWVILP